MELERKLSARGYGAADIVPVLVRLTAQGALDEARLAETYAAERVGKGFGPLRIRAELREKGLPDAVIDPYLETMNDAWPDQLTQVYHKRFGLAAPTDHADYGRRGRFLEGRGFPPELIHRLLRQTD
ncbi:MAG TPA: regulatory protein RecX [Lamprocystis sp. (in: g-proteobacteria)]|nr:regulatory protein RecX [Lamprocystis sp. (in: g-proteobacteria)]